jgi:protein-tyrosine phosphatase
MSASQFRVTTICLGNICRSPMAEIILRDRLAGTEIEHLVTVDSAGTGDWHIGYPADPRARETLLANGYPLHDHTSRQINESWIPNIHLALVMDSMNYVDMQRMIDSSGVQTELRMYRSFDPDLGHLVEPDPELDVPDPYYGGDTGFRDVLDLLERSADGIVQDLHTRLLPNVTSS